MSRRALISGKTAGIIGWFDFFAILGPHHDILPCVVLGPTQGQIGDAARLFHVFKTATDLLQNETLLIQVPGAPCGLAKRIIQIHRPWRAHRQRNRASAGQAQSGNAFRLKGACDQSNGLMTDGSDWNQQGKIDFVFFQFGDHRRCQRVAHFAAGVNPAHKGQRIGCQGTNAAVIDQIIQSLQG